MHRHWVRRLALSAALGLVVLAVATAALFGPYLRDDWRLDRIVRVVALDWRDFGRDAAWTRLQHELDRQGVGLQVGDDACAFDEPAPEVRRVRCAWRVEVEIPVTGWRVPLSFASEARVDPDGALR